MAEQIGWDPLQPLHILGLEFLHAILHDLQLRLQASFVIDQSIQLLPQDTDVSLKDGVEVFASRGGRLLLEQFPLGL